MKKAILALLVVSALAQAGCFVDDPAGQFTLSWSIAVDGRAGTCEEIGGKTVEVISTNNVTGDGFSDKFNCSTFAGTTAPMPPGDYTVTVSLYDAGNVKLNAVDIVLQKPLFDGDLQPIGNFQFTFTFAKASFRISMGNGTTANCVETGAGAAGVALEEIRVSDAAATQCLPFDIEGVTDESDQPVVEQTCSQFLCQFRQTVHVITGLESGTYLIQVLGYKGATGAQPYPCYVSAGQQFTVNGGDVNLGTIVAPFTSDLDSRCDATKPEGEAI